MPDPNSAAPPPGNQPDPKPRTPRRDREDDDAPRQSMWGPVILIGLFLSLMLAMSWKNLLGSGNEVDFSVFWKQLVASNVAEISLTGSHASGKWKVALDAAETGGKKLGESFSTHIPEPMLEDPEFRKLLRQVSKFKADDAAPPLFGQFLFGSLFLMGILLVVFFIMRRSIDPSGTSFIGSFGKAGAKRFKPSDHHTTFLDVAAMEAAKGELLEIVEFLKTPERFHKLGAQIPKGVLLMGSPGTGKTLLARATAGEAGVPFFTINGSEFIQMFVGVGASRVRDLFQQARENAPCIIFVDEIDAVGRVRGAGLGGGHDEREQTLNQILSEMDGFSPTESVIVMAATNRPDVLDPALLRPGRFDRHITIDRPTKEGRQQILKVHVRKVPLADDVELADIAASTIGFTGAELKNLVNEAALSAVRAERNAVIADDFDVARDRILMGAKREEVLNDHEKAMTAYHEAGHALLAWFLPDVDPVHKVTIIPRGRALGVTQLLPEEDRYHYGEKRMHSQMAMMLAGRAAEKLVFDEFSAGAEDDLKRATSLARRMVSHWGMSEKIGPVAFRQGEDHPFLGKELHEAREFSEETAHTIDLEVQRFLHAAADRASKLLAEHRQQLDAVSKLLLQKESIDHPDIVKLLGPPIPRTSGDAKKA
ncbi:MAG: ATP-dependent zinc metalloprotease FtsH [Planctomycetaceae bacterium]